MFCEESEELLPGGDRAAAPAVGTKDTSGRAKFNFLEDTSGRFSLLLPCMLTSCDFLQASAVLGVCVFCDFVGSKLTLLKLTPYWMKLEVCLFIKTLGKLGSNNLANCSDRMLQEAINGNDNLLHGGRSKWMRWGEKIMTNSKD
ncbi:hypothetical protein RUM43_007836 [Polyplax serrata]|uniref:Uncharacterized protein n=1 Tax=Polyplax serrata TaxID=468196 RepID=A0AAN8PMS7_POLSC